MPLQAFVILLTHASICHIYHIKIFKNCFEKSRQKKVFRNNVNLKNAIKFLSMSKN